MATILLNESNPRRRAVLRTRLQRLGHMVWSANHLHDVVATLHDVAVDLMILDLDDQDLEALTAFAGRWQGIKIVFQASSMQLTQDFRSWMADQFVFKLQDPANLTQAVAQLLPQQSHAAHPAASARSSYAPAQLALG